MRDETCGQPQCESNVLIFLLLILCTHRMGPRVTWFSFLKILGKYGLFSYSHSIANDRIKGKSTSKYFYLRTCVLEHTLFNSCLFGRNLSVNFSSVDETVGPVALPLSPSSLLLPECPAPVPLGQPSPSYCSSAFPLLWTPTCVALVCLQFAISDLPQILKSDGRVGRNCF